jgi:hypothetical protein
MAWRLNDLVVRGELFNTRSYSTHGWVELKGQEQPLVLELTGNCSPDLRGWHIQFEARPSPGEEGARSRRKKGRGGPSKKELQGLAWQQIGPTGTMTAARKVRVADCPPEELYMRFKAGEPPPMEWKRCLTLEWFSQNGRVVIELADPILEVVEYIGPDGAPEKVPPPEPEPDPPVDEEGRAIGGGFSATSIQINEDGEAEIRDETPAIIGEGDAAESPEDPYGLFSDDLRRQLEADARDADRSLESDDDRFMRETERMDDLIEHGEGETLQDILGRARKRPLPDGLSDERAEGVFKGLLAQLALYGIALHVCEHFTPREAYKLLLERILPEEKAFPQLRGTGWTQSFMTSEYCPQCAARAEREWKESQPPDGGTDAGDAPGDEGAGEGDSEQT